MKRIVLELHLNQIQIISIINFIKQNFNASEYFQLSKSKIASEIK